tara:strand:+ start:12097 stop:12489 length:393 start_codon:yes stop_codon:yes gene_type:complete
MKGKSYYKLKNKYAVQKGGVIVDATSIHNELDIREFYSMEELVKVLQSKMIVWSWGARNWTKFSDYVLGFTVNGHHHKGWVLLMVNVMDTFDILYTDFDMKVLDVDSDINIESLISVIDEKVEYINEYKI